MIHIGSVKSEGDEINGRRTFPLDNVWPNGSLLSFRNTESKSSKCDSKTQALNFGKLFSYRRMIQVKQGIGPFSWFEQLWLWWNNRTRFMGNHFQILEQADHRRYSVSSLRGDSHNQAAFFFRAIFSLRYILWMNEWKRLGENQQLKDAQQRN